jgi:hypothetical protein
VGVMGAWVGGDGGAGSSTRWQVALPSAHRDRSIDPRMGPAF